MNQQDLIDPGMLAELRRIELRTKRSIDTDLMGRYRSAFRGSGLTFSDLREYQPGDDVRRIHWKVTARTAVPYIKTFDEDRQLNVVLAVDISASTATGGERTKHRRALEFAALIGMLGAVNQDSVGLLLFSDQVEEYIPSNRRHSQFKRIISCLLRERKLHRSTDIGAGLKFILQHQRKRAVLFLVSDFIAPPFEEMLERVAFKHDVIGVHLGEPLDTLPPKCGLVTFADAENGALVTVDTSSRQARESLLNLYRERSAKISNLFRTSGADLITVFDNPLRPLSDLMHRRTRRH